PVANWLASQAVSSGIVNYSSRTWLPIWAPACQSYWRRPTQKQPRRARQMTPAGDAGNAMSESTAAGMPPPSRDLSCRAAIVGLGETDYHLDYKAARTRPAGYEPPTPESLASTAFERALA